MGTPSNIRGFFSTANPNKKNSETNGYGSWEFRCDFVQHDSSENVLRSFCCQVTPRQRISLFCYVSESIRFARRPLTCRIFVFITLLPDKSEVRIEIVAIMLRWIIFLRRVVLCLSIFSILCNFYKLKNLDCNRCIIFFFNTLMCIYRWRSLDRFGYRNKTERLMDWFDLKYHLFKYVHFYFHIAAKDIILLMLATF